MTQTPVKPLDMHSGLVVAGLQDDAPLVPVNRSQEVTGLAVTLLPVDSMIVVLDEYATRRRAFRDWLKRHLKEGIHFGYTPGTKPRYDERGNILTWSKSKGKDIAISPEEWTARPGLYKAGAQLLCDLMMIQPTFEADEATARMLGVKGDPAVVIKCTLICRGGQFFPGRLAGDVLGEGRGAFCVGEKGMNENSAIKLAQKRALVDAVINTLGVADLFTQDIEDANPPAPPSPQPEKDPTAPRAPTRSEQAQQPKAEAKAKTPAQLLHAQWVKANPGKKVDGFLAWVKSKLPSIQRDTEPSAENPLTADDCEMLAAIIQEETGQ